MDAEFVRWRHLLFVANALVEIPDSKRDQEVLMELLNSIDEYFPRTLDPEKNFEAYAVRQFCKALKKRLTLANGK